MFELDGELLRFGPPPERSGVPVPHDTRLDASATAAALGVELPSLRAQLEQLRREFDGAA